MPTQLTAETRAPDRPVRFAARWTEIVFAAALVVGVAVRVQYGRGMPLWFDETFTGTIATQPTPSALLRWCLTELTGPVFYGAMWLWAQVAGAGTEALRLPSLLLSIGAPLLIAARGHPDRELRLLWASVALLWLPIVALTNDARPYPMLFAFGCAQAMLFLRLMRAPGTRVAFGWSCVTAALALTHYSALAVGGAQGVIYLLAHRRRALATWPAATALIPAAVWMAYNLPYVFGMTMGGDRTPGRPLDVLAGAPADLFGIGLIGVVIAAAAAGSLFAPSVRAELGRAASPEAMLAASGAVACAATVALAAVHISVHPRYLTPSAPALLFGVAWWLRGTARVDARPAMLVLGVMGASACSVLWTASTDRGVDPRHLFGFETASRWLMEQPVRRVVFLWTDPVGDASPEGNVADVAGFVFRRDGRPVRVEVLRRRSGTDTSLLARMTAGDDPEAAILWIANDRQMPDHSVARIAEQDPRWDCREFGGGHTLVHACRRERVSRSVRPAPSARVP